MGQPVLWKWEQESSTGPLPHMPGGSMGEGNMASHHPLPSATVDGLNRRVCPILHQLQELRKWTICLAWAQQYSTLSNERVWVGVRAEMVLLLVAGCTGWPGGAAMECFPGGNDLGNLAAWSHQWPPRPRTRVMTYSTPTSMSSVYCFSKWRGWTCRPKVTEYQRHRTTAAYPEEVPVRVKYL